MEFQPDPAVARRRRTLIAEVIGATMAFGTLLGGIAALITALR